jgi:thiol-disulfide isomerase/thioredoxin
LHPDAVYHTAIVIEGIEYFYGAGIQTTYAGSTHHGQPMEVVPLGKTNLPLEIVLEYLDSLKKIYTPEAYDLFLHNCNNFSNDFSMFLVGKGIPDHITSLPRRVLDTPFGQMLKPQLEAAMRPITQAPIPPQNIRQPASNKQSSNGAGPTGLVHNVTSVAEVERLLQSASNSCATIFFTSSTCAPCKICYPVYDELAAEAGNKTVLIKVDINQAHEVSSKYGVRATPTFMTFQRGQKQDEWAGADPNRLRGTVRLLINATHPPHPHSQLRVPKLLSTSLRPVTYTKVPPLDKVIAKLGSSGKDPIIPAMKNFIEAVHGKRASQEAPLPSLPNFAKFIQSSISSLPQDDLFAAYDIFRLAVADARVGAFFAEEMNTATILQLLQHVNELGTDAPYNLRIVALHVACNLFSAPLASHVIVANETLVKELVRLLQISLLDEAHVNVRIAAASLSFNLAAANHRPRMEKGADVLGEGEQVEIVAALLEGLSREDESKEVVKGLSLALGLLAYSAPIDGELLDLCTAMEAKETVSAKEDLSGKDPILKEVVLLL